MVKVANIIRKSLAYKAGIKVSDSITSINGTEFCDIIDYIYAESLEHLEIELLTGKTVIIDKSFEEPTGLVFDDSIELVPMRCNNKCVFCFVDQLPCGMRESLYIKDDDYRLSFSTGSYITTTNLEAKDIERIIKYKLSPLYLSVHAFEDDVRTKLTNNPKSKEMFNIIKRFAEAGITMHTQIVLCPSINDKEVLKQSLTEMFKLYPAINTVSIVPVGLTSYREKLYDIKNVHKDKARETIEIVEEFDKFARTNAPLGFCWCSDEMYLRAEKKLPKYEYYGAFMQIGNGVGLVREFLDGISLNKDIKVDEEYHLITGVTFYPILCEVAEKLSYSYGVKLFVHKITNKFFGESITVAGLITAQDIINQLKDKLIGKKVIIPSEMLKEFQDITLDGMSIEELEKQLQATISICHGGEGLEDIICGV